MINIYYYSNKGIERNKYMFTCNELKLHTDFVSILKSKLYINQFIRLLFDTPPEKKILQAIVEDKRFLYLCEISQAGQTIQEGITSLLLGAPHSLKEAKEEYNRLFVGPNALPAPLWESVYLSKEHIMFGEQTLLVREIYKQHGLSFVRENNEPDDHIVTELEFLNYLIERTIISTDLMTKQRYLDAQLSFLNDHLVKWCPQFCELFSKATQLDLYKGVALLLDEYIQLEIELTIQLKEELQYE